MIPEEIKNKISVKVFEYSKENSPKQVVIPAFHDGAIFGYCLSLTEIEGLKKEIAELKSPIAVPISVKSGEESKEDEKILKEAKASALIIDWFEKWCSKTKRGGGVLITTSIKELLYDFYTEFATPTKSDEVERLKGLTDPFSLKTVLTMLSAATERLLKVKDYDGPDYEELEICVKRAKEIILINNL